MGAIPILDTVVVCERPNRSFGNVLEVKENPPTDLKWLEREHNTAWYRFVAPAKATLTFDIIPEDPEDDIDFLLFAGSTPDICGKIPNKEVAPVRSNISRNDKSLDSRCGLSMEAAEDYVRSGVGSSYSRAIDVEEGDLYFLLVDYPQRPRAGFSIHFHYHRPPPAEPVKEWAQTVVVQIRDSLTGAPMEASLMVEGLYEDSIVQVAGQTRYEFKTDLYRKLRIDGTRQGYMFRTVHAKTSGRPVHQVEMVLVPIRAGTSVVLEDIRFVGNGSQILRGSEDALHRLLRFMEENPEVNIEVQGHVNGPSIKRNNPQLLGLSTARAQAVYDFLVVNDVDPARVSFKGMGNAYMLFPDPRNEAESEANRRVEVKVTGYTGLATPSAPAPRRSSH